MEICPAVTVVGEGGFVSGGEEAASALYYKGRRRAEGTLPAEKGCYGRALSGRAPGGRWRRGRRHTPTSIPAIVSAAQPSSSFDDHDARMVHCGEGETKKRRRLHYRETETTLNDHEEEATDIGRWLLRLSPEEIYHLQRQGRCYVQNVRVGASLLDAMSSNVSRASLRTRIEVYDVSCLFFRTSHRVLSAVCVYLFPSLFLSSRSSLCPPFLYLSFFLDSNLLIN